MYQINALNPKDEGHHTRKRFGQNFLHDQRVIAKIVRSVNPRPGENVVEIGPGLAALTSPLIGDKTVSSSNLNTNQYTTPTEGYSVECKSYVGNQLIYIPSGEIVIDEG